MNTHSSSPRSRILPRHKLFLLLGLLFGALTCHGVVAAADLFASGTQTGSLFQIAPDGTQTTFSTVTTPRGLAFDAMGNLYVADGTALAIIKITPGGTQSTFVSGLTDPRGIAFDADGNLFVCNAGTNEILKFTPGGMQSTFASGLDRPADIAFDADGNLFESDRLGGTIQKFTPGGMKSTFASGLNLPAGLAFDSAGNLYEVDQGSATVMKFAADGTGETFTTFESGDFPIRVAIDASDNVYVSDLTAASGPLIYKFTPTAMRSTFVTESETVGFIHFGPEPAVATGRQLLNISTRLNVLTDDKVLIGGFIIDGTVPKKVIVRAIGPSLGAFGIPNFLADPVLELNLPDGSVITNDDWKDAQQTEIENLGFAPSDDRESAIVATLDPGAYTAIIHGANGTTGVALVEAYDLDTAAGTLANISTRGFVNTGDNAMIGGFIIGGDTGTSSVLVRGIGPALTDFGVAGALQDPTLELFDGSGNSLATNDNWKDTQQSEIATTGLQPSKDLEAAILATLSAGNYTAILRGHLDTTGVGLVEVYHLN